MNSMNSDLWPVCNSSVVLCVWERNVMIKIIINTINLNLNLNLLYSE